MDGPGSTGQCTAAGRSTGWIVNSELGQADTGRDADNGGVSPASNFTIYYAFLHLHSCLILLIPSVKPKPRLYCVLALCPSRSRCSPSWPMAVEAELSLRSRPAIPHHHHPQTPALQYLQCFPSLYVCHNFNSSSLVRPSYLQMLRGIAISMRQQYSSHYEMFFLLPLKWKICSQVLATNQEIFRLWQGRRRRQVKFNLCISFLSVLLCIPESNVQSWGFKHFSSLLSIDTLTWT